MAIETKYSIFGIGPAAADSGQVVVLHTQHPKDRPRVPLFFDSEQDALNWAEENGQDVPMLQDEFVVLPVRRFVY